MTSTKRPGAAPRVAAVAAQPAIEAAANRAAIERETVADPLATPGGPATAPIAGAIGTVALEAERGTTVLPDPAVPAVPGGPAPLVTASPPLTGEPSAVDVARADAAAIGVVDPAGTVADHEGPHGLAAAQPTLAIEPTPLARSLLDATGGLPGYDIRAHDQRTTTTETDRPIGDLTGRHESLLSAARDAYAPGYDHLRDEVLVQTRRPVADFMADEPGPTDTVRVEVVEVVGPRQGFRRAGFAFGPEPRRFLRSQLTDAQLNAIRADPMLAVGISEVDIDTALLPDL